MILIMMIMVAPSRVPFPWSRKRNFTVINEMNRKSDNCKLKFPPLSVPLCPWGFVSPSSLIVVVTFSLSTMLIFQYEYLFLLPSYRLYRSYLLLVSSGICRRMPVEKFCMISEHECLFLHVSVFVADFPRSVWNQPVICKSSSTVDTD